MPSTGDKTVVHYVAIIYSCKCCTTYRFGFIYFRTQRNCSIQKSENSSVDVIDKLSNSVKIYAVTITRAALTISTKKILIARAT